MATFPSIAFERPATEERLKAIGPTNASPPALQRALATEDFASLPAPGPRDWLAVHPELARPLWRFGGATEPPGRTATHHLLAAAGKFEPAGWCMPHFRRQRNQCRRSFTNHFMSRLNGFTRVHVASLRHDRGRSECGVKLRH